MSHYTTMVFVKDEGFDREQAEAKAEELLEPYDENTQVAPYERETWTVEELEKARSDFANRLTESDDDKTAAEVRALDAYGYLLKWEAYGEVDDIRHKEDASYAILSTYNPLSKWDWYVLGGRWEGQQLRDGSVMPWGQIKDLDLEGARTIAGLKASELYDKFEKATKGLEAAPSWKEVRENMFPGDVNAAREFYNNHPWVAATREMTGFFSNAHDVFFVGKGGRKAMVEDARANVATTYAAVDPDGGWNAKGEMGWFGMSSGDDKEAWAVNYAKLFESMGPDDWWFQYDLHI